MSNYFQLLGIKPTKDKEAIKKAFIAKLMESLPINSNEQAFACHQTLSAWNFLSVPENLKAQYKYATSIFSKKDSKQEVSNSVNAQTLKV